MERVRFEFVEREWIFFANLVLDPVLAADTPIGHAEIVDERSRDGGSVLGRLCGHATRFDEGVARW